VAITDNQLDELHRYARAAARDLPAGTAAATVLETVLVDAAEDGMRTLDEFDAPVSVEDLPDARDRAELVETFRSAHREHVP
jgi:hypothetical protein